MPACTWRRLPAIVALLALFLLPCGPVLAGEYAVQFTVPSDKEEVWKFVEMLSDLDYPAYMFTQDRGAGMVHYYAQMGTYATFDAAQKAAKQLQRDVRVDFEIVHANSNKVVTRAQLEQDAAAPQPEPQQAAQPAPDSEPAPETAPAPKTAAVQEPAAAPNPAPKAAPEPESKPAPAPKPAPEPAPTTSSAQAAAQQEVADATPAPKPSQQAAATAQAPASPVPASTGSAVSGSVFLVQLHSFSIKQNALEAARDYARKGYTPVIILLYDNNHTPWYVLSLGHYADRQTASKAASTFRALEDRSATLNQVDASFLKTRVVPFN